MAPRMAAVLRAPGKLCSFSYVLFVFLLFYVLDVVSITVYDRDTLLNIGSSVAQRKPDFEFLNAGGLFTDTASEPFVWVAKARRRRRRRKRGKRAGVLIRLRRRAFRPPLPTILLANVQSLDNKLCELRARISYQRETRDCCVICLTETWMSAIVPDSAIELTGFSVHRSDRTEDLTGKSRGGGVCFYINNLWCDERNIHSIKSFCSPDLEFHTLLCRPFWLPREFTAIIITAVYIPPQANTDQALKELYRNISEQETTHPDAAFVITGDFNKANFRTIAPKYFQHVTINTRGDRTLDHCYSPFRDAYKSLPRPPFGKSDHSSVLLLPAYRQKLKREAPALSVCGSLMLQKNPSLCPYQRKTKSHAWMTGGPLLWPPSSASVLRSWSETTSALCCLLHWTHYNLHTAVTVPQTMLLPSPCTLLSPTWKIKTPMWGCCSWIIVQHLTL